MFETRNSRLEGRGAFATEKIKKGTTIIEYIGRKVTKEESEKILETESQVQKHYIFELNDKYDIDGNTDDNVAKYINHSCDPNCEIDIVDDHIYIKSIKPIKKGEELTYDYKFDFSEDSLYAICRCNKKKCRGFMFAEDQIPLLKEFIRNNLTFKRLTLKNFDVYKKQVSRLETQFNSNIRTTGSEFKEILESQYSYFLAAFLGKLLVGFVLLDKPTENEIKEYDLDKKYLNYEYVYDLIVDKPFRGKGVGKLLFAQVFEPGKNYIGHFNDQSIILLKNYNHKILKTFKNWENTGKDYFLCEINT